MSNLQKDINTSLLVFSFFALIVLFSSLIKTELITFLIPISISLLIMIIFDILNYILNKDEQTN